MIESLPIPGLHLQRDARAIYLQSDTPLAVTSSAVVGGDLDVARHILNMHVEKNYACDSPANDLNALAGDLGIAEPFVGMMTAVRLERVQVIVERNADTTVVAIVTVGLSHPTAAGAVETLRAIRPLRSPVRFAQDVRASGIFDATSLQKIGTINAILVIDARLPRAARVNAIITATEAKTLALVEANVRAPHGGFASGTATDAIVVATTERGARYPYAGPLTPVGAMIGRAIRQAIQNAVT